MPVILRIIQQAVEQGCCAVSIVFESPAQKEEAAATIPFLLSPEDGERFRWYLEEYLQFPTDPAPLIAEKVELRMQEIGFALFDALFKSSDKGAYIWQQIKDLSDIDLEIMASSKAMIPWELMQNPLDNLPIACQTNSFIRVVDADLQAPPLAVQQDLMRVLLVISRPKGDADVPFRSVAARLLHFLGHHQSIQIEVLRPSTFEALEQRLQAACYAGHPFRILHFDGHGIYASLTAGYGIKSRKRGYLMFEDADNPSLAHPMDGRRLGTLLVENEVPLVILNACRSARSEPAAEPSTSSLESASRSFGSLAEELIKSGVTAVVAMQYNIYVPTAAHFVATLYWHLAEGETLPAAMNLSRRHLFENADRRVAAGTFQLKDWIVPVLFQAQAAALERFHIPEKPATRVAGISNLPLPPASGFVGRDNTLLNLDRLFQNKSVVVLWGMMGNGKTATASEFGKWMLQTQGLQGGVLFTSFKEYKALPAILNEAALVLHRELEAQGIEWLTLSEMQRLQVLLDLVRAKSYLWIWDNFEAVTQQSHEKAVWSAAEVDQLGEFLQKITQSNVKVLITSRVNRLPWPTHECTELELPSMEPEERIELVTSILGDPNLFLLDTWKDLLSFSQGNPLVLSLLSRQFLMHRDADASSMKNFLAKVRSGAGEDLLERSIRQALLTEFNIEEQRVLAPCWLFEGVVSAPLLDTISHGTFEVGKDTIQSKPLLDRMTQLGLFTPLGSNYYSMHPGLPPYLKKIFYSCYAVDEADCLERRFALIYSLMAQTFYNNFDSGQPDAAELSIQTLRINEANLRRALTQCLQNNDALSGMALLYGLYVLYKHFGRWTELGRLIDEVLPYYVDIQTNKALQGREELWTDFQHLRVELFRHSHRLSETAQLQQEIVLAKRQQMKGHKDQDADPGSNVIRGHSLPFHLLKLAGIQREQGVEACLNTYSEALEMAQRSGYTNLESDIAFELATVYMDPGFLNLDEAEYWLRYALDTANHADRIRYGNIRSKLGQHALMQYRTAEQNSDSGKALLKTAVQHLETALQILPLDLVAVRATCLADLGHAFSLIGENQSQSISTLQEVIRLAESVNDTFRIGENQLKLAKVYRSAGNTGHALHFAEAALRTYASLAPEAEDELLEVLNFLETVEEKESPQEVFTA